MRQQALWKVALALLGLSAYAVYQGVEKETPLLHMGAEAMSAVIALDIFRIGFANQPYTPLNLVIAAVVSVVFVALWATASDPLSAGAPLAGKKWPIGPTLLLVVLSCEWYMQNLTTEMEETMEKTKRLMPENERKDM